MIGLCTDAALKNPGSAKTIPYLSGVRNGVNHCASTKSTGWRRPPKSANARVGHSYVAAMHDFDRLCGAELLRATSAGR